MVYGAGAKVVTIGTVEQANAAPTLARVKGIVRASTTHLAQTFASRKRKGIGAATATSLSQPLSSRKAKAIVVVTQPQLSQPFGRAKRRAIVPAVTLHQARVVVMPKRLVILRVSTQHIAQALIYVPQFLPLGSAVGGTDRQEVAGATALTGQGEGASERVTDGSGAVSRQPTVGGAGRVAGARGKVRRR
jgi:hypothetical protein